MGLFSTAQVDKINKIAEKSKESLAPQKTVNTKSINDELNKATELVREYFKDSPAILIHNVEELHEYVTKAIEVGYAGIDTETTGLDRIHDWIVGASLYYPGGVECYIPMKHIVPIFDSPYKGQLTYSEVSKEFQRLADSDIKLIFANADFDLAMINKDLKVDLCDRAFFDVILAWRILKENEPDNALKTLYSKYVLKGEKDGKKFKDFFTPKNFPYSNPEVAKLYAANDAKITYELFIWELPFLTKTHKKCQKNHLEKLADLFWNVEMPLVKQAQILHRIGIYFDKNTSKVLKDRYFQKRVAEEAKLAEMVNDILAKHVIYSTKKKPFTTGAEFNPTSPMHVKYLLYEVMQIPQGSKGTSTDKEILKEMNLPITNQILNVRSLSTLINSFVKKLPNCVASDGRIHPTYKTTGASTGRMSSAEPNAQNIPSHAIDIRHQFRATAEDIEVISVDDYSITLKRWDYLKADNIFVEAKNLESGIPVEGGLIDDVVVENITDIKISFTSEVETVTVKHPAYVMLSSDYSAQEPRLTAFVSGDKTLIKNFQEGKDVYAGIASIAYNVPYEHCLEFHPETGEYQPDGKKLRGEAKVMLLGLTYGRAVSSLGEQLYGNTDMTEEQKLKGAQKLYDTVMNAFPGLRNLMISSQKFARQHGYVETILGRRRHIPEMKMPEFEFKAMSGYVNPDVDPLDPSTLENKSEIPERIIQQLTKEFHGYKYFGQIAKRSRELYETEHIKVINNRKKITEASRKVVNSIIQGSAADQTKLAILNLTSNLEWQQIGGRLLTPVHDELIAEVPMQYWKEGGDLLSKCMCDAANFLPFPSKCDVTTTLRWYGLEYPCKYKEPEVGKDYRYFDKEEVKWLQYHLFEMEYALPIIPNPDGSDLKGDAALGVNGQVTPEYEAAILDYIGSRHIQETELIPAIKHEVVAGTSYK